MTALADPLSAIRFASRLLAETAALDLTIRCSTDFDEFAQLRLNARGTHVSPMFDPGISKLGDDRAFWLAVFAPNQQVVSLQAFRLDLVYPNLAEWALGWMAGLYLKRKELVLPSAIQPPAHSRSHQLSGALVYHGEMWIEKHFKARLGFDIFPRLGMLIAYMKWQPAALWALTSSKFATHGYVTRSGYGHQELGFLQWEWEPEGADNVEWLIIADRGHMELLIAEEALVEANTRGENRTEDIRSTQILRRPRAIRHFPPENAILLQKRRPPPS